MIKIEVVFGGKDCYCMWMAGGFLGFLEYIKNVPHCVISNEVRNLKEKRAVTFK